MLISGLSVVNAHVRCQAPDPSIRGDCFVVTSDSHPHVLPMYAPVRALAPPRTHRLLDGQAKDHVQRIDGDGVSWPLYLSSPN
jgi:hypothetical protein